MNKIFSMQSAALNTLASKGINAMFAMIPNPAHPYVHISSITKSTLDEVNDSVQFILRIETLDRTMNTIQNIIAKSEEAMSFEVISPFIINYSAVSSTINSTSIYANENGFLCGVMNITVVV